MLGSLCRLALGKVSLAVVFEVTLSKAFAIGTTKITDKNSIISFVFILAPHKLDKTEVSAVRLLPQGIKSFESTTGGCAHQKA